jgi:hypothetical protein
MKPDRIYTVSPESHPARSHWISGARGNDGSGIEISPARVDDRFQDLPFTRWGFMSFSTYGNWIGCDNAIALIDIYFTVFEIEDEIDCFDRWQAPGSYFWRGSSYYGWGGVVGAQYRRQALGNYYWRGSNCRCWGGVAGTRSGSIFVPTPIGKQS